VLKIEARATQANKQKEVGFDSQNYPQYLCIKNIKTRELRKAKNYRQNKLIIC
jgi:hypothetical protein